MKLLFDENLSPRLVALVADRYPASLHVRDAGLRGAADRRIWEYARAGGFVIASKDDDFRQRSLFEGAPPKVVWLRVGDADTLEIAELLRRSAGHLREFEADAEATCVILDLAR